MTLDTARQVEAFAATSGLLFLLFLFGLGFYAGARWMDRRMRTPRLVRLDVSDAVDRA